MSEHSRILEKYEKMFEDGSAYQPIKIQQPTPSMAEVTQAKQETPLGNPVTPGNNPVVENSHTDYSHFDAMMEEKINNIRNGNTNLNTNPVPNPVQNESYQKLEKRIELLERALTLVMEQQTKLLKESK
jgi:hypothetical protein